MIQFLYKIMIHIGKEQLMKKIYLILIVILASSFNANLLLSSNQSLTDMRSVATQENEPEDEIMEAYFNRTQPSIINHRLEVQSEHGSCLIGFQTRSLQSVQLTHSTNRIAILEISQVVENRIATLDVSEVIENHLTQTVSPLVGLCGIGMAIATLHCTIS